MSSNAPVTYSILIGMNHLDLAKGVKVQVKLIKKVTCCCISEEGHLGDAALVKELLHLRQVFHVKEPTAANLKSQ